MKIRLLIILCLSFQIIWGQQSSKTKEIQAQINAYKHNIDSLNYILEDLQLDEINQDLQTFFLPKIDSGENLISHKALFLVYDEQHEQAKWVLHKISTNILEGKVSRTNDFRIDPLVKSGSA
ncbi:MAG: hypothetical protein HOH34_02060, partial [Flavobacteriales bacterium]|nr:hypothetical protein [Flavobacteriales bacterium]